MFSDEVVNGTEVGPVEEGRYGSSVLVLFAILVLWRALITAAGGVRTPDTTTTIFRVVYSMSRELWSWSPSASEEDAWEIPEPTAPPPPAVPPPPGVAPLSAPPAETRRTEIAGAPPYRAKY